ncbi:MAG: Acetoacetate--CoA ligase [Solirubrobacterales bacterium]|nr:Acetoacetate--CoA ligase [Solirubrobacterales bacterium]
MSAADRQGMRVGASEIYRAAAAVPELDEKLTARIRRCVREACSPAHVPDEIHQIDEVPGALCGTTLERMFGFARPQIG